MVTAWSYFIWQSQRESRLFWGSENEGHINARKVCLNSELHDFDLYNVAFYEAHTVAVDATEKNFFGLAKYIY